MPSSRHATITRSAISPRLAISIFLNKRSLCLCVSVARHQGTSPLRRFNREQALTVLDGLSVLDVTLHHFAVTLGVDLVHQLHCLDDAEHLTLAHGLADVGVRFRAGLGRAIERADD